MVNRGFGGMTTEHPSDAISRGLLPRTENRLFVEQPSTPIYAKSWALVIGIDTYRAAGDPPLIFAGGEKVGNLRNAKNDARAIAELLRNDFDFDGVVELYDGQATRSTIMGHLQDTLSEKAGEDDRLIIFFAGHGLTQKSQHTGTVGYLLPAGARKFSEAISMDELRNVCNSIPAKHILILLDCCFSGSAAITEPFSARQVRGNSSGFLGSMTATTSWQLLAAGRKDQPVADSGIKPGHSAFTAALLSGMQGAASFSHDGMITGSGLADYVFKQVVEETGHLGEKQEPVYRQLLNGETGNFVFLTPERRLRDQLGQELLALVHEFNIPLHRLARCFHDVCHFFGHEHVGSVASPAAYLRELWNVAGIADWPSPILLFVATLAAHYPSIAQRCELWQQKALAEPRLKLQRPGTPTAALPPSANANKSTSAPFLTVSLLPIDAGSSSAEGNFFKVHIYFWQTQRSIVEDRLCSLSEAKTLVARVLEGISKKYPDYSRDLTIEFCLPLSLLSADCEQWPKPKDLIGETTIGIDHPVVVRCIDGLKSPDRRPYWEKKWQSFAASTPVQPPYPVSAICRDHQYVPLAIYKQYLESQIFCLGLTGAPEAKMRRETPLTELLQAGIPIAVWPRAPKEGPLSEENVYKVIHEMLQAETLHNLPDRVKLARRQIQDDADIARHLVLLWDDYDRIPPGFETLETEAFDDLNL
jgi:hypothetical protein